MWIKERKERRLLLCRVMLMLMLMVEDAVMVTGKLFI